MRIWMDPERLTSMGMTADDVITAIREQNIQAAVGSIGSTPAGDNQQIQYTLRAKGRLNDVEDFKNIIVRTNAKGGLVRISDIARVELGARSYGTKSILNGAPTLGVAVYRSPGANALDTMKEVRAELKHLAQRQPSDVQYQIIYDTTKYVSAAIYEIGLTLFITFLLVVGVTFLFLQDWRATLVPTVAIPVSLVGTFAVLLALTSLSPALCAVLLRRIRPIRRGPLAWFSRALDASRNGYVAGSAWLIRRLVVVLLIFVGIFGASYYLFETRPTSFLPEEDLGAFLFNVQLPEASALDRTAEVMQQITKELKGIKGVQDVIGVSGFSLLSGNAENVGFGIGILDPWDKRTSPGLQLNAIVGQAQGKLAAISSANSFAFVPPPIQGLGMTGGFDFRLQALGDQSPQEIAAATRAMVIAANQDPALMRVFATYTANTPQIFVDLDRTRAETLKVPVSRVFSTLQAQLGSRYANDFNLYGRVYQVKVQADAPYRDAVKDIGKLYVRNNEGKMVPMDSLATLSTVLAPQIVSRYNQFTSVQINGGAAPGFSSGDAMAAMKRVAAKTLPEGYAYDWSAMSFQEQKAGGQVLILFALALVFSYLFLVGQYESWNIPISIIISIPVAVLGALTGLWIVGLNLSIYAQIGLVLLVGLASKNAILIVEFAKDRREQGLSVAEAAVEGARIRFRPVLMTAFSFILGVTPLVIATGAGAASRRAIGTTVFSGMLAATLFGIFLVPALYYAFQTFSEKGTAWRTRRRDNKES
ncbi:Efflux pump membrane transporter BepG [subsurface metagenome]